MATKRLYLNALSIKSIDKLKKAIVDYENDLQAKLVLFCERLSQYGVEAAQANIVNLDAVFSGDLFRSIYNEQQYATKDTVVFIVATNSEHAIYVEMGTGMVGAENPYPGNLPAVYRFGKTTEWTMEHAGSGIRKLKDGRYGWFYQRDGQWYFTEGMPSRPFMWFASMDMQEQVVRIAREVFGNV